MAPAGTVRSIGPSVKVSNDFSSPRISTAFAAMFPFSFLVDDRLQEREDVLRGQSGLRRFTARLAHQLRGTLFLVFTAAVGRRAGDEGAEPLPPVDDAVALQLLVGALDRDHADHQVLGQAAERGQRGPRSQPALADFAFEAVDDLLIEG